MNTVQRSTALSGCILSIWAPFALAFDYGVAPNPLLELDTYQAAQSAEHRLIFDVFAGELETYRAVIHYPDGFRFNGFDALGPDNTPVGAYELDLTFDGIPEVTVALRSLNRGAAYADIDEDQVFSLDLEPIFGHTGWADFELRLPFGGDANPQTLIAPFGAQISLVLFAGALANPETGGDYTVSAELTSVDPDNDSADDGLGAPPLNLAFELPVTIDGPSSTPFAEFTIDKADLKLQGGSSDRFMVHGHYTLDSASDGLDLMADTVTVLFDAFSQDIPGQQFQLTEDGYQFKSKTAGVKQLKLFADGRFQVDARDLNLAGLDVRQPVTFVLRIGNDFGATEIPFDSAGHYRP